MVEKKHFYYVGQKTEDILKESKGVVEGLPTLKVVYEYAQEHKIFMPILESLINLTLVS